MTNPEGEHDQGMSGYGRLFLALGLSLIVMFPLTMAFVAQWSHFHLNLSNFYMAVVIVAPMGLIMLGVMRGMFPNPRLNVGLVIGFVALFALGLWLGRTEAFVGNEQFLRAMIPHHSRAILVCNQAAITDPDIEQLCDQIVATQQEEIGIHEPDAGGPLTHGAGASMCACQAGSISIASSGSQLNERNFKPLAHSIRRNLGCADVCDATGRIISREKIVDIAA